MPLFGILGFSAHDARFERHRAQAMLRTRGGRTVGLMVLPWATRPSTAWRDVWLTAEAAGSRWCFVLAPPFLSLVDTRGHVVRRSVEFDLSEALPGSAAPVFRLLAGAASFDAPDGQAPAPIDGLLAEAMRRQDRVRGDLRRGVVRALQAMGGVLEGRRADERVAQALTLVYRVLFLKFVESRDLVPVDHPLYAQSYSMTGLCREALREDARGLWDGLAAATRLSRRGCRTASLILPPFNGELFRRSSAPALERRHPARPNAASARRDAAIRAALLSLGTRQTANGREELSFGDLGVEELGSVYERVLDFAPDELADGRPSSTARRERAARRHSDARKRTGTFYTPQALTEFLVARTLAPLVAGRRADEILTLRIVDPAMGSGAFLVCACRYLAAAYERALLDEGRASPVDLDEDERAGIRRLVAERCLAGVDVNPVAVQLARLSLWLTTLTRGKPLGFLDHRLRVGNSLVGASPGDLSRFPNRRRSAAPVLPLFDQHDFDLATRDALATLAVLRTRSDDGVADVRAKERLWTALNGECSSLHPWRRAADLWCAQWFWPDDGDGVPSPAEVRAVLAAALNGDRTLPQERVARRLAQASAAAKMHAFFHWPLEFSDVFSDQPGAARAGAGFDAVLGNPPWEMLRRDPAEDRERRTHEHTRHLLRFIRDSGIYADSAGGHLNLYQPFLERALGLCRPGGHVGLILPWGVAVDDGSARLRQRLFRNCRIRTLVGFDNGQGLFPIHRGVRFLALTASVGGATTDVRASFGLRTPGQIDQLLARDRSGEPSRDDDVRLSAVQVARVGGASLRIPFVQRRAELAMADRLAAQFPPFGGGAWNGRFGRELNATEDRQAFGPAGLPVIEGKHIEPFRTRETESTTRIGRDAALTLMPDGRFERQRLAYRDVSGHGNRQSLIAAIVPADVVTTHTLFCLRTALSDEALHFLCAVFNSYVINAIVRMLMGSHLTTSLVEHLPVPDGRDRRYRRIARLARRRRRTSDPRLNAAIQAQVARMYGVAREEFAVVLEGFPLVPVEDRHRAAVLFDADDRR